MALIAIERECGKVESIYCGYPDDPRSLGSILLAHYVDPVKVSLLISKGDAQSVSSEYTVPYSGNKTPPEIHENRAAYLASVDSHDGQYLYLFSDEGVWHTLADKQFVILTPHMVKTNDVFKP